MTIISTKDNAAMLAEFTGGAEAQVDIMIGVGLVKDSEAVFFQYQGDNSSQALVQPSGKPVTRIAPVKLTGLTIAEDVYSESGFDGTKLNIFLETQNGVTVMLTSGLTTIWSQCVITGLMGLADNDALGSLIALDSWKGNSKMKPCFAAIRNNGQKVTSDEIYEMLAEARSNRDAAGKERIMRDCIAVINEQLTGIPVVVKELADDNIEEELGF